MRTRAQPLFDRFILPRVESSVRGVDSEVAEVIESIGVLLNTRSPFSLSDCEQMPRRTVLDYGMPDFLHISPVSRDAIHHLARSVQSVIQAHESRITVIAVDIDVPRPCRDAFRVLITGEMNTRNGKESVMFPVEVR